MDLFLALSLTLAAAGADEPFDYFTNSWATVGLRDYSMGTRISPSNELLLGGERRLRLRLGRGLLGRACKKTLLEGWLPVAVLRASEGSTSCEIKIWASPLPSVKDWKAAYAGPAEGENYLNWVSLEAENRGSVPVSTTFQAELRNGQGSFAPFKVFSLPLSPGAKSSAAFAIPFEPTKDEPALTSTDADLWLRRTVEYWKGVLASGAAFEVPEKKVLDALRASHVNQLIGMDSGEVRAGEGFYDEFYIRDGAYQVMQLEEVGFLDDARRAMASYLRSQKPDGRFESQQGQLDANGQALWTLWQFHRITGDSRWLREVYPSMRKAAVWIGETRARSPAPFGGLLPAAVADGEFLWDGKHHIVGYDFWNLRGLRCVADAALALGESRDAEDFTAAARAYREAIDLAWKRTGLPHFPPSWEAKGTHWGNTETLWPTAIFDVGDPRVRGTIDEVRKNFGGGFLEGTIRWCPDRVAAIHPYMSSYTTLASLSLGEDEKFVEEFYWYLLHSTAAHSLPEGIYHKRRIAWGDTIPHLLGAAQYANLLRHMLIHEEGNELHLLRGVPDAWLGPGKTVRVERAPTHFGPLSIETRGDERGVAVKVELGRTRAPAKVFLHLPKSREAVGVPPGVEVIRRPDQKVSWSFDVVAKLYRDSAPRERPLPKLVSLPLGEPLSAKCIHLDLKGAATTDPFVAPFGVQNPGNFLFTGLPTGVQRVGGVPFEVIDPAKNSGKGIVVLQGAGACSGFPKEVSFPVGSRGKRIFFLGHVHGWAPEDEGVGDWGALAECAIQYVDGSEDVIPWIAGRTTDDWASPPLLDDVCVGLQGNPWHLNVVGMELRPLEVKRVVFRDLGTPSSPVLVAVTVEP